MGAHLPLLDLEPVGGEPLMSVTCGQCDARPTVTLPATRHHHLFSLYLSIITAISRWTWLIQYQNVSILSLLELRITEITQVQSFRENVTSNETQFYTGQMAFVSRPVDRKSSIPTTRPLIHTRHCQINLIFCTSAAVRTSDQ